MRPDAEALAGGREFGRAGVVQQQEGRQLGGDVADATSLYQEIEDLVFACRQRLVHRPLGRGIACPHGCGQLGAAIGVAGGDVADGAQKLIRRTVFGYVACRAFVQHAQRVLLFGVHRQYQDAQRGAAGAQAAQHFNAADARQRQVQEQDIAGHLLQRQQDVAPIARLADHGHVGGLAQELAQALAQQGVVISKVDADHGKVTVAEQPALGNPLRARRPARGPAFDPAIACPTSTAP